MHNKESEKPWHAGTEGAARRLEIGTRAENEWMDAWRCFCGGRFQPLHTFKIDCTCDTCGQLVNVKTSPATEKYGNITISQRPLDNYPPDLLIAVRRANDVGEAGRWVVCYAQNIEKTGPFEPTHKYRPTQFYKVSLETFVPPETFGFVRI